MSKKFILLGMIGLLLSNIDTVQSSSSTSGDSIRLHQRILNHAGKLIGRSSPAQTPAPAAPKGSRQTYKKTVREYLTNPKIHLGYAEALKVTQGHAARGHLPENWELGPKPGNWVEHMYGDGAEAAMSEHFVNNLNLLGILKEYSLAEITYAYQQIHSSSTSNAPPSFYVVGAIDAQHKQPNEYVATASSLAFSPLAQGNAIVQIASQFNYLESQNSYTVPLTSGYLADKTQGPVVSVAATASSIARNAVVRSGQIEGAMSYYLKDINLGETKCYENGYLQLQYPQCKGTRVATAIKTKLNADPLLSHLKMLPQWGVLEQTGGHQLQVFMAAMSFQDVPDWKTIPEDEQQLAQHVVVAQYDGLAKIAVILHDITQHPVNLHLTYIGQSSFRNPPYFKQAALQAVANIVKHHPGVRVFVHAYRVDKALETMGMHDSGFTPVAMSAADFREGHIPGTSSSSSSSSSSSAHSGSSHSAVPDSQLSSSPPKLSPKTSPRHGVRLDKETLGKSMEEQTAAEAHPATSSGRPGSWKATSPSHSPRRAQEHTPAQ